MSPSSPVVADWHYELPNTLSIPRTCIGIADDNHSICSKPLPGYHHSLATHTLRLLTDARTHHQVDGILLLLAHHSLCGGHRQDQTNVVATYWRNKYFCQYSFDSNMLVQTGFVGRLLEPEQGNGDDDRVSENSNTDESLTDKIAMLKKSAASMMGTIEKAQHIVASFPQATKMIEERQDLPDGESAAEEEHPPTTILFDRVWVVSVAQTAALRLVLVFFVLAVMAHLRTPNKDTAASA